VGAGGSRKGNQQVAGAINPIHGDSQGLSVSIVLNVSLNVASDTDFHIIKY
jgi:hypothetical protein